MTQPTASSLPPTPAGRVVRRRVPLTVADLPPLMSIPASVDTSPYRFPLSQFIWDWNVADDRPALITEAPIYRGPRLAVAPRRSPWLSTHWQTVPGCPCRGWVLGYRSPPDVMLFGWNFDGGYARWVRGRSPAVCAYHRVWFHPRTLDKGTPDWWLPWD